jgi:hypothetical protein
MVAPSSRCILLNVAIENIQLVAAAPKFSARKKHADAESLVWTTFATDRVKTAYSLTLGSRQDDYRHMCRPDRRHID